MLHVHDGLRNASLPAGEGRICKEVRNTPLLVYITRDCRWLTRSLAGHAQNDSVSGPVWVRRAVVLPVDGLSVCVRLCAFLFRLCSSVSLFVSVSVPVFVSVYLSCLISRVFVVDVLVFR